jgi:hypothetical protein
MTVLYYKGGVVVVVVVEKRGFSSFSFLLFFDLEPIGLQRFHRLVLFPPPKNRKKKKYINSNIFYRVGLGGLSRGVGLLYGRICSSMGLPCSIGERRKNRK